MTKEEALKIVCKWIEHAFPHPDASKLTECWRLYGAVYQGLHLEKAKAFLTGLPEQRDVLALREFLNGR